MIAPAPKLGMRQGAMAVLRMVAMAAGALLVFFPAGSADAGDDVSMLPRDPIEGRFLFEDKQCDQCHGLVGAGPDIGPELGGGHFSGSFFDLGAALWNHVPGMSVAFGDLGLSWPTLNSEETLLLISFLYYIDYLGKPGVATAGRRVFIERGCAGCHRVGTEGSDVGPDLTGLTGFASPLYIAQAVWNHGPAMFETMRERRMAPRTFEPGDLADLSAYIRGIGGSISQEPLLLAPGNPERGREYFTSKGCGTCHPSPGGAGGGAPDLRDQVLPRSAEGIAGVMWNHAMAMSDEMKRRQVLWPQFTTQEFADLVSFLYFLPFADVPGDAARGARVFAERSCAGCHGGGQDSTHPGPQDLTGPAVVGSPAALVSAMWNHAPVMKEAVLSEGRPWPELTGENLRDLFAHLKQRAGSP